MAIGGAATRYTRVAILLHWLIALGIILILALGLYMTHGRMPPMDKFKLFQLHKSIGITILLLVLVRLAWRIGHRPPPLPADMQPFEQKAANTTHVLLYLFMLGLPLTGWMMVSSSPFNLPTILYGLIPWPHLPVLSTLANKKPVEQLFKGIHEWGAWILIGFVMLHIGAALRHHFIKSDDILTRMLPGKIR